MRPVGVRETAGRVPAGVAATHGSARWAAAKKYLSARSRTPVNLAEPPAGGGACEDNDVAKLALSGGPPYEDVCGERRRLKLLPQSFARPEEEEGGPVRDKSHGQHAAAVSRQTARHVWRLLLRSPPLASSFRGYLDRGWHSGAPG